MTISGVESLDHDAGALALTELHGIFNTATFHAVSTSIADAAAVCPSGNVIIWGYSYQYSKNGSNACFKNNNKACVVGDRTCIAPRCFAEGPEGRIGRITILCAANKIPGSYAKSNLVTTGGVGGSNTVSCDGTDKIVTGVKYAMVVITVLCAPSKYGEALVQYVRH